MGEPLEEPCRTCLMISLSLGFLIGGAVLWDVSASHERQAEVEIYNTKVDAWSDQYRGEFADSTFALQFPERQVNVALASATATIDVDPGPDVQHYDSLAYKLPNTSFPFANSDFTSPATAELEKLTGASSLGDSDYSFPLQQVFINATYTNKRSGVATSTLLPIPVRMTTRKMEHVGTPNPEGRCQSRHGIFHPPSGCEVFGEVTSVCVEVQLDNVTGAWALAERQAPAPPARKCSPASNAWTQEATEQYGCQPQNCYLPASYRVVSAPSWANLGGKKGPPKGTVNFGVAGEAPVRFEVRSKFDPGNVFTELTHGEREFPMSDSQARWLCGFLALFGLFIGMQPALEIRACCAEDVRYSKAYNRSPLASRDGNDGMGWGGKGRSGWVEEGGGRRTTTTTTLSSSSSSSSSSSRRRGRKMRGPRARRRPGGG